MAQACPRAKGMPCSRQVSASQYQVWTHSHPTRRSGRNGSTAARNGSGLAGRLRASRRLPAWSRTQRNSVLACRSTPTYDAAVAVRNRMVKTPGARETGTFNSIPAPHLTRPATSVLGVRSSPVRAEQVNAVVRRRSSVCDGKVEGPTDGHRLAQGADRTPRYRLRRAGGERRPAGHPPARLAGRHSYLG